MACMPCTLFWLPAEASNPRVQGLTSLAFGELVRSVRGEKGPLDLFLNPAHPIFRRGKSLESSVKSLFSRLFLAFFTNMVYDKDGATTDGRRLAIS